MNRPDQVALMGPGSAGKNAALLAARISGAMVALPLIGLRLNCCFLIFAASVPKGLPAVPSGSHGHLISPRLLPLCFLSVKTSVFQAFLFLTVTAQVGRRLPWSGRDA
jgi:hypothetical protein